MTVKVLIYLALSMVSRDMGEIDYNELMSQALSMISRDLGEIDCRELMS